MIVIIISGTYYLFTILTITRNRISYKKSQLTKEYLFVINIIALIFVAPTYFVVPCLQGEYQVSKY